MSDAWLEFLKAALIALPPTLVGLATLMAQKSTHKLVNSHMDARLVSTHDKATAQATQDERDRADHEKKQAQEISDKVIDDLARRVAKLLTAEEKAEKK